MKTLKQFLKRLARLFGLGATDTSDALGQFGAKN